MSVMRLLQASIIAYFCTGLAVTHAAVVDAREVARINNCAPKKIEVFQQTLGIEGKTIYRVECNLPKAKDEDTVKLADALLIQCTGSLCGLLRMVNNNDNSDK